MALSLQEMTEGSEPTPDLIVKVFDVDVSPIFVLRFECEFFGIVSLVLKEHAVKKCQYTVT
jgi:hypothetical protein